MNDAELLRSYVEHNSEPAFCELVQRYAGLVHSSALRQTNNSQLAEDVTQAVFIALARKAPRLQKIPVLAGWLFRATRFAAAEAVRKEVRRQHREEVAALDQLDDQAEVELVWDQAAPLLDEALATLNAWDRDAVLLRFFQNKRLKEVATDLGCTEDAAKKRVARALDRLRRALNNRGVVLPTVTMASALSAHSVEAAPMAITASLSVIGASKGGGASGSVLQLSGGILKAMLVAKVQFMFGFAIVGLLLAMAPLLWPRHPGSLDPGFKFGLERPGVESIAFSMDGKILVAGVIPQRSVVVRGQRFIYSGFVRLNNDGSVDTSFSPFDEPTGYAIALQKDGKVVIGGDWAATNSLKHANIARLNPDGTLDATFHPGSGTDWIADRNSRLAAYAGTHGTTAQMGDGTTGTVFLASSAERFITPLVSGLYVQEDDKVLVIGRFKQIAGMNRDGFARLNSDGTPDRTFNPPAIDSFNGLLQDGRIMVTTRTPRVITRLASDGGLDPSFEPITNIDALAVAPDGSLLGMVRPMVVGYPNRPTSTTLLRFHPDGSRDTGFEATFTTEGASPDGSSLRAGAFDRKARILIVGHFDKVNGIRRSDIARLNPDGSVDKQFNAGPRTNRKNAIHVFVQPDDQILISGQYIPLNGVGTEETYLVRLKSD